MAKAKWIIRREGTATVSYDPDYFRQLVARGLRTPTDGGQNRETPQGGRAQAGPAVGHKEMLDDDDVLVVLGD